MKEEGQGLVVEVVPDLYATSKELLASIEALPQKPKYKQSRPPK